MASKISPAVRSAFREVCSDWLVLRTISDAFDAHGFTPDQTADPNIGGQRRTLVEEYYANINWADGEHVLRFLHVMEDALMSARSSGGSEDILRNDLARLERALTRDGFELDLDTLTINALGGLTLTELEPQQLLNEPALRQYVTTMQQTADARPSAAIGAAKNLIEATAKLVLDELNIEYGSSPKMPALITKVQDALGLHAKDIADDAAAADDLRQILGGLQQVALGISNLRNHYGDGHGQTDLPRGLEPRHAHLAIGAADTYARFLLETLERRRTSSSPAPSSKGDQ